MKRKPTLFVAYRKNKFRDFCRKQKWRLTGALSLIVIGTAGYYYYSYSKYSYRKSLDASNPFVITDKKEIISEDVLRALQDTAGRKISVQSIYTGYDYWQGKPLTHKTKVEGTLLFTDDPDSISVKTNAVKKEDPYFINADIATIEKKMSEMAGGGEIKLSGPSLPKKFTGYLSEFKKNVLGWGEKPKEVKFTMVETKEAAEKK